MSLFVNLSKSIAGYISKSLAPIATTNLCTEFAELRSGFKRFCQRKSKQHLCVWKPPKVNDLSRSNSIMSAKRRRSLLHVRCDKRGFNSATMLTNMRLARLYSINAHQKEQTSSISPPLPSISVPTYKLKSKAFIAPTSCQQQTVRTKCGRENCEDPCNYPVCPPFNKRWPSGENKLHNIYEAYWDSKNEDCCKDDCKWAHMHPRFDDMYLQESDKAKRIYKRTWSECPVRIKQKRICCFEGEPPEICYRPKKERPQTACPPPEPEICDGSDKKCQKIKMPCCCDVRKSLICKPLRGLLKCKKFCTPYPSFSECLKPKMRPKKRVECFCLERIPMCEYWVYWRKRILSRSGEKC